MEKLMDIKGYWDMSYSENFNDKDMWMGQILLQDNGWFEGIVVDNKGNYKKDSFIFGVCYKDKVIELFKFTPFNISSPFVFQGFMEEKGYDGIFQVIKRLETESYGSSRIILENSLDINQINDLKEKIQRYKDLLMNNNEKYLYNNYFTNKNKISKSILKKYYKMKEFEYEMQLIREEAEKEDAKKLTKKLNDGFDIEGDTLPF